MVDTVPITAETNADVDGGVSHHRLYKVSRLLVVGIACDYYDGVVCSTCLNVND